jgi:hypothetical protein
MTKFQSISDAADDSEASSAGKKDTLKDTLLKRVYDDVENGLRRSFYLCTFSVEKILKLSLSHVCGGCHSPWQDERCQFVGCHASLNAGGGGDDIVPVLKCSAVVCVEDPSDSAQLVINDGEQMRRVLGLSVYEWERILVKSLREGELLYLAKSDSAPGSGGGASGLSIFCDLVGQTKLLNFHCKCRVIASKAPESDRPQSDDLKLYCVFC